MVVYAVADVDAHKHSVVLMRVRDQKVFFVLHLHYPWTEVLQFPGNLIYDVVDDRVQTRFVGVVEESHVVLFVVVALLRLSVPKLRVIFAALLVALQLDNRRFSDHLNNSTFVENVEYFEFLL